MYFTIQYYGSLCNPVLCLQESTLSGLFGTNGDSGIVSASLTCGAGGAIADLLDLQSELSSLQKGLTEISQQRAQQKEKVLPVWHRCVGMVGSGPGAPTHPLPHSPRCVSLSLMFSWVWCCCCWSLVGCKTAQTIRRRVRVRSLYFSFYTSQIWDHRLCVGNLWLLLFVLWPQDYWGKLWDVRWLGAFSHVCTRWRHCGVMVKWQWILERNACNQPVLYSWMYLPLWSKTKGKCWYK